MRRLVTLALLCISLTACFEDPVDESLTLEMLPHERVKATAVVTIQDAPADARSAMKRLNQIRESFLASSDPWSSRFGRVELEWDRVQWVRTRGVLGHVEREGVLPRNDLDRFFSDTAISTRFVSGEGWEELTIQAGASDRATREQRAELERTLTSWSQAVEAYCAAIKPLYDYLDLHPDRAALFFKAMTDVPLDGEEPSEEESHLFDAVGEAQNRVLEIFSLDRDRPFTINEISSMAYDPFPARVTLIVPGPILEKEGFVTGQDGRIQIRRMSLWDALESLEGTWVSPDPLLIHMQRMRAGDTPAPVDIGALAAQKRLALTPSAAVIRAALAKNLEPTKFYRLRWRNLPGV